MRAILVAILLCSFLQATDNFKNPNPSPFVRGTPFDAKQQPNIRLWADGDYLYWWTKNGQIPVAIATSGIATDVVPAALGSPGTKVLFGNESLKNGALSGFRFRFRNWVDAENNCGIEGVGFYLPSKETSLFSKASSDVLGVPFYNAATFPLAPDHGGWSNVTNSGNTAILLGYEPTGLIGSIQAFSTTQLWGVELNGLFHFYGSPVLRLSAITGATYTDLSEHLNIQYTSRNQLNGDLTQALVKDRFWTHNEVYALQIGIRGEWSDGWLFASFLAKFGLGANIEICHIHGSFVEPLPNIYYSYGADHSSGVFAQPSNIGRSTHTSIEAMPSLTLNFGVNLLRELRLSIGYDFLLLSNVLRPGNQIDSVINETQAGSNGGSTPTLTGIKRPKALMDPSIYWAQGINAGLEARF